MSQAGKSLDQLLQGGEAAAPVREALTAGRGRPVTHTTDPDRLTAFAENLLERRDHREFQAHLSECPACALSAADRWRGAAPIRRAHAHPWRGAWEWVRGEVSAETAVAYEAHLERCPTCAWWAVRLQAAAQGLGRARTPPPDLPAAQERCVRALDRAYRLSAGAVGAVALIAAVGLGTAGVLPAHFGPTKSAAPPSAPPPGGAAALQRALQCVFAPDPSQPADLDETLDIMSQEASEPRYAAAPEFHRRMAALYALRAERERPGARRDWLRRQGAEATTRAREAARRAAAASAVPPSTHRPTQGDPLR